MNTKNLLQPVCFCRSCLTALVVGAALHCAGCTPSPAPLEPKAAPTAIPSAMPTPAIVADAPPPTPIPTETASPTATPVPITIEGPFLIYKKPLAEQEALVLMQANSQEKQIRLLPQGTEVVHLTDAVSPDGKWLAFYTGSAEIRSGDDQQGPYDLALSLMELSTGQIQPLTPLLSTDYPENFRQAADALTRPIVEGVDSAIMLQDAFVYGITSLAWSPDGHTLAFAGQMEGPTSDLYLYDHETQSLKRLSDEPEQIQSLTWSPDGAWIVYGSANHIGAGMETLYRAVAVDGSAPRDLSAGVISIQRWLAPDIYLQWDALQGLLQSVDIETGTIQTLWGGSLLSTAFDPANGLLAVVGREATTGGGPTALFLIDLRKGSVLEIMKGARSVTLIGGSVGRQFIVSHEGTYSFMKADGSLDETGFSNNRVESSTSLHYTALLGEKLELYTWGNNPVCEIALPRPADAIDRVIWRTDLPGLFLTSGSELYAVDISDREARLVDEGIPRGEAFDFIFSAPEDIGPEAVWGSEQSSEFSDCHFDSDAPLACVASVMQASGAAPQAIAFTQLLQGEAFMIEFEEYGTVDVARVMYTPRTTDFYQTVLVNGTPRIVYADMDLGAIDLTQDSQYPALVQAYPRLTIWESLNSFDHVESLPNGGRRFVIRYDLVDYCHVCRTGDSALVAFDFDRTGQFIGTSLVSLEESSLP